MDPAAEPDGDLPFIDEHRVHVSAPAAAVWQALAAEMAQARFAGAEIYAHLVAAEPRRASGPPLGAGATFAGFAVTETEPERDVRLAGRHLFSRYSLSMSLREESGGTVLSARSHALFPGPHGWVYRQLVIGSGAHQVLMKRMLRSIRRRAERQAAR